MKGNRFYLNTVAFTQAFSVNNSVSFPPLLVISDWFFFPRHFWWKLCYENPSVFPECGWFGWNILKKLKTKKQTTTKKTQQQWQQKPPAKHKTKQNTRKRSFSNTFHFKVPVLHMTRQRQWQVEVGPAFKRSIWLATLYLCLLGTAKKPITLFRWYFDVCTRIGEQDMFIKLNICALENTH